MKAYSLHKDPSTPYKTVPRKISYSFLNKPDFIPKRVCAFTPILFRFKVPWHMSKRKNIHFPQMSFSFPFLVRHLMKLHFIPRNKSGNQLRTAHSVERSALHSCRRFLPFLLHGNQRHAIEPVSLTGEGNFCINPRVLPYWCTKKSGINMENYKAYVWCIEMSQWWSIYSGHVRAGSFSQPATIARSWWEALHMNGRRDEHYRHSHSKENHRGNPRLRPSLVGWNTAWAGAIPVLALVY